MALKMTADSTALLGTRQMHDIEQLQLRILSDENRRNNGKIFGNIIGDAESRQRAAGNQYLFADFHDIEKFGGIGIEIDNIRRFPRRLRARVHRHGDIGLRQRGCVVGAVADHGHKVSHALIAANQFQFCRRFCFRHKIVNTGFRGNGCGRQRIIAGNHDGLDAHLTQFGDAAAYSFLENILETDCSEDFFVLCHQKRS